MRNKPFRAAASTPNVAPGCGIDFRQPAPPPSSSARPAVAFTLMELLVVMGIIALLAVVSLPAIRGISKSNAMAAANRQLLDDVALARQYALSTRSKVYMIFVPPLDALTASDKANLLLFVSPQQQQVVLRGQQTAYALFSGHTVGDQPGGDNPRYLTPWRFLPEGVFIPAFMFTKTAVPVNGVFPLQWSASIPFPVSSVPFGRVTSFYIIFAPEGGLIYPLVDTIPLAQGSVLLARNPGTGGLAWAQADILERPPNNSIVNSNHIRIDWLTGRARIERAEIP